MMEETLIKWFKKYEVIKEGHFILTSGKHSDKYINKDKVWQYPTISRIIINLLKVETSHFWFDVITGPALAGAVWAAPVSHLLKYPFVYPDKQFSGRMLFRRGFDRYIENKRVLIIEDIVTTGSSIRKTVDSINRCNGKLAGIVSIWNRSGWRPKDHQIKIRSLINQPVDSWYESECPLCKSGNIPLTDPKK